MGVRKRTKEKRRGGGMVARLPGAPSFTAQGMLGQAGAWWAVKHGCLWRRQAVPQPGR
jgi:hypothetical protein